MSATKAHKFLVFAAILLAGTTAHAQFHAEAGAGASAKNLLTGSLSAGASYSWEPLQVQAYGLYQWKHASSANVMAGLLLFEHHTETKWWLLAGTSYTWYIKSTLESRGGAENGISFQAGFRVDYGKVAMQFDGSGKTVSGRFVFKFFNHSR